MAEEIIKRVKCERCPNKIEIETKPRAVIGIVKNPRAPSGWGHDLNQRHQLCPDCMKSYDDNYEIWYNKWFQEGPKEYENRTKK